MKKVLQSLTNTIEKVEVKACVFILVTLLSVALVGIFFRYILGKPLSWVIEVSVYLVIWLSFLSISVAYKRKAHPMVEAFVRRLSSTTQNYVALGLECCIFFLLILVIKASVRLQSLQFRFGSEVLGIPTSFASSTPVLVSFISMLVSTFYFIVLRIEQIGIRLGRGKK